MAHFHRFIFILFMLFGLVSLSACGGGDSSGDDTPISDEPPADDDGGDDDNGGGDGGTGGGDGEFYVIQQSPENGATGRALVSDIRITFSKALMASTVTENSVTLSDDGESVALSIQYNEGETEVMVEPQQNLSPDTLYTLTISNQVMAHDGSFMDIHVSSFMTTSNIGDTPQEIIDECMSDFDIDMLAAVNDARAQSRSCGGSQMQAVPALAWNCLLEQAAEGHSSDMATNNFFDHTGSDGSDVGQRVSNTGYEWRSVAENIAAGYASIALVMEDWIDSPGHCENIMRESVTEFGASRVDTNSARYSNYWTQNFARSF